MYRFDFVDLTACIQLNEYGIRRGMDCRPFLESGYLSYLHHEYRWILSLNFGALYAEVAAVYGLCLRVDIPADCCYNGCSEFGIIPAM